MKEVLEKTFVNARALNHVALDTSVMINLLASGAAQQILRLTCKQAVLVPQVVREVKLEPETEALKGVGFREILNSGEVKQVELRKRATELFLDLVTAERPDSLDDGEAATIAYASLHDAAAALDDTKGRRICRSRFPHVALWSSIEVLSLYAKLASLDVETLRALVYRSLKIGKMHVTVDHDTWVRELLGPDLVSECPSLRRRRL
jgi:predicted nucleic acid-binding protein